MVILRIKNDVQSVLFNDGRVVNSVFAKGTTILLYKKLILTNYKRKLNND